MIYTGADTWYPSWAADGNLYSPWTDGRVNGLGSNSSGDDATTGYTTILGSDPLNLVVTNQGVFKSSPRPYAGRYPCGSLVYHGVWYYGTYCLHLRDSRWNWFEFNGSPTLEQEHVSKIECWPRRRQFRL